METIKLVLESVWKILLVGIVLGAGLPALFAVGVRGLAVANGHESADGTVHRPDPFGAAVAVVVFVVVVAAIAVGITIIVASGFGKAVSVEHIYPTLVEK
ncbi:hypothetical protein [Nocardia nova]|uniref:hypothetical protein n=1 Tax=Nocardia nova TaxID=37330 RepID=UPI001894496B|nr:hypothetical protein [Nocardia nova]MBF6147821.1 hypothetical protein [Nocardia nova]